MLAVQVIRLFKMMVRNMYNKTRSTLGMVVGFNCHYYGQEPYHHNKREFTFCPTKIYNLQAEILDSCEIQNFGFAVFLLSGFAYPEKIVTKRLKCIISFSSGYPSKDAVHVALNTVRQWLEVKEHADQVTFMLNVIFYLYA